MLVVMDQERYELVDVIGSGGMATVWRARDTRLGRVVAIKRPHPAPADSTTLPRFAREARAAATVNHPNLVSVYDVGEDDLGPYLVMEFVDGPSLATTAVPRDRIAAFGVQMASALGALHAAGIVHGDVKPANILVGNDGVKLTDFGIARTGTDTTALTREGVVFATPEYAAPETLASGDRTAAGDVYALGAVLHELVTGSRWNTTAGSPGTTAAMPPAAWLPALSGALATDPSQRPSAAALEAELSALQHVGAPLPATVATTTLAPPPAIDTHAPHGPTDHRDSGRRATVIFAVAILALAAVAGLVALTNDGDGIATTPATEPPVVVDTALDSTAPAPATVPTPTVPPPTEPAPTEPAPTEPPPTEAPSTTISPARALGQELADVIAQEVSAGLDRDDAIDIVDDLNDALVAAESGGDDDDVERALRSALRRIDRQFSDDTRDGAIDRLVAFGAELGVDPDDIIDDDRGPRDRDDDDD
jgi:eukaryotic-like serine/threonine-protein kinase